MNGSVRRRVMNDNGSDEYIQDGLVFWLDGINKGDDPTRWTDLIGGKYFTLTAHSTANEDNVWFDGAGYITGSANVAVSYDTGTIEVCSNGNTSGVIYIPAKNTYLSFLQGGAGYTIRPNQPSNCFSTTKVAKKSASFTWEYGLVNGKKLTTKVSNNWNPNTTKPSIGGRSNGTAYYYTGKVYSIRIYNRKLTEKEMRHNQKVDNKRFKLGLKIAGGEFNLIARLIERGWL